MTMADIFGSRLTKLPQSSNTMDQSCVDRAGISLLSHSLAAKVQRRNLVGATAVVQQIHAESAKKRLALLHGDDEHRADWVYHSQDVGRHYVGRQNHSNQLGSLRAKKASRRACPAGLFLGGSLGCGRVRAASFGGAAATCAADIIKNHACDASQNIS